MALTGLKDDYVPDGRVVTEVMSSTGLPTTLTDPAYRPPAACYKQLNSSVGRFGTDVIVGSTPQIQSGTTTNDTQYQGFSTALSSLGSQRDALATTIKNELYNAAFNNTPPPASAGTDLQNCNAVLAQADQLAAGNVNPALPESPMSTVMPAAIGLVAVGGGLILRRRRRAARLA